MKVQGRGNVGCCPVCEQEPCCARQHCGLHRSVKLGAYAAAFGHGPGCVLAWIWLGRWSKALQVAMIMHGALCPAASNAALQRGWQLRVCSSVLNPAGSEAALLDIASAPWMQGQEATAAAATQSRQYFSLSVDFSEDVGGGAKVCSSNSTSSMDDWISVAVGGVQHTPCVNTAATAAACG